MVRRCLSLVLVLAASLAAADAAGASDTPCTEALGAVTVNGNVSAGAGCDLSGTTVNGNVTVNPGGSLTVTSPATITGNVRSKGATTIFVLLASVGGNVQIDGTTGQSFVGFGTVGGNVEIKNSAAFLEVGAETVGGNVHLHHNTGSFYGVGVVAVGGSTVHGNVEVHDNSATGSFFNAILVGIDPELPGYASSVDGNLKIHNNQAAGGSYENGVFAAVNGVGGNLEVHNNTATGASGSIILVDVGGNTVTNNLSCKKNTPAASDAFGFGPNTAAKKTGECANL